MVQFELIGKLKEMKGGEKFSSYETKLFDSGWENIRYRFNVISGTNRIMCEVSGGKWQDDSKNKIYAMSRPSGDKKSEKIIIDWNKRKDPEIVATVAGWRIYTIGLTTDSAENHNFLDRTDYAQFVKDIVESGEYKDAKFKIIGNVDYQYSAKDNKYYSTYSVNKIYKVDDNTPDKAEITVDAFYTADAFDMENYEETGKCLFHCYTDYYFTQVKAKKFIPLDLIIRKEGENDKRVAGFQKRLNAFDDGGEVRKVSILCNIINGSEMEEITIDDLTDEQREDIEWGLATFEDICKSLGGSKAGNYTTEYRVTKLAKNSLAHGSESTIYTVANLKELPIVASTKTDDVDIFADDEI